MNEKDNTQYALDIVSGQAERTIRRLSAVIIALIVAWALTIAGFIWYLYQYDFTGTTTSTTTEFAQDGEGLNIINRSGAFVYGTETENDH